MIFMIFFLVVHIHEDAHCLAEHIDALHQSAQAVFSLYFVADFGKAPIQFFIGLGLVLEAAHQTPADAGDLAGIEREILLLGHLDGDRDKITHPGMTAQRSAADAVAAQYFGLVADADLAQFDAGAEYACQVLDQVAKVHAPVRRKVKEHLAVVKSILRIDELHLEAVLPDLLLADAVGFFLLGAVAALGLVVLGSCDPNDVFERLCQLARLDVHRKTGDSSVLNAADGLNDHVRAVSDRQLSRVKIENLAGILKPHADHMDRGVFVIAQRFRRGSGLRFLQGFCFRHGFCFRRGYCFRCGLCLFGAARCCGCEFKFCLCRAARCCGGEFKFCLCRAARCGGGEIEFCLCRTAHCFGGEFEFCLCRTAHCFGEIRCL